MRILVLSVVGWALTGVLYAQETKPSPERDAVELALSDETLNLRYLTDTDIVEQENSGLQYAVFLSEERDLVGSAALMIGTDLDLWERLEIRIGPKAYAALLDEDNSDVFGLAIGAEARFEIVSSRDIALAGHAFYSPDVLTFGSADNVSDFEARAEMRFADRLIGLVGFRWFELKLFAGDEKLQDEVFAGVRWELSE